MISFCFAECISYAQLITLKKNKLFIILHIVFFAMNMTGQNNIPTKKSDSLDIRTKGLFKPGYKIQNKIKDTTAFQEKIIPDTDRINPADSLNMVKLPVKDSTLPNLKKDTVIPENIVANKKHVAQNLRKLIPHGTISVGYDYGFLPYTVNSQAPTSAVKVEGLVETDVFNLPFDVSFFYTTQKNLIGLSNYFRISYNADRYKEKLNSQMGGKLDACKNNLNLLNNKKQQLMQKMAYADYLSSISPDKWPIDTTKKLPALNKLNLDTTGIGLSPVKTDTSGLAGTITDTLKTRNTYSKADSLRKKALVYKTKVDSVAKLYETYKSKYALLSDSIKKVQNKIDQLETLNQSSAPYSQKSPYLNKVQNFLSGVKKMEVGLCYPAYSTFLTNNVPVRGINFEYQKNNRFFAFTYGTTVSTLLYSSKNVEGFLQNVRNSYNYFDVNNLSSGRKILSAKFGFGEKDGDHFFAGFLVGKSASTYFAPSPELPTPASIQSNLVLEADVRKKISRKTYLDIVLGKSSLQDADLNLNSLRSSAKELFSSYRSYAMLVKLKTSIRTTKSTLNFSVRWIDPFFNSFGVGFIRSDNMRYEAKLDQPLGKLFKYTVALRYEEDNLLRLLNYKNTFYSINNTLSYRIKKGLTLRLGYTPLIRTLRGDNYRSTNKNSIVTGILTFTPRSKNIQKQFSLLYNSYRVNTDSTPLNFQNFAYYHQFSFKGGFKTGLNISWFKNNLHDSTGNDIFLAVLDCGYQFKNGSSFSVAGKSAYKKSGQLYPGFIVKSTLKLTGFLFWDNQVEKFIVGDLFNGYDLEMLKKFPYCYTTKLTLNF